MLFRSDVTGPAFTGSFAAVVESGRGTAIAAPPIESPAARIEVPWPDLVRRACGRVPADEPDLRSRVRLYGDSELAEQLLRGLAFTP